MNHEKDDELRRRLNSETSKLRWTELQRHYAGGNVIAVDNSLDLIEVAVGIAQDDTESVKKWMADGRLAKLGEIQAAAWLQADVELWAVVVKPWVLVQRVEQVSGLH
ncbi:DUF2288 domain-containing protein [Noviherbaspirillum sp. 1P10PC]|uniref:DUF2288 domain-containing protein n=1 Tax=Noviherbaspirillum sp. 1P10PC TaxID=3132292 RepID=UPI0039A20BE3